MGRKTVAGLTAEELTAGGGGLAGCLATAGPEDLGVVGGASLLS